VAALRDARQVVAAARPAQRQRHRLAR
jgi:hypothetical protein